VKKTLLAIDDDESIEFLLNRAVQKLNLSLNVECVETRCCGLKKIKSGFIPDLIIVDYYISFDNLELVEFIELVRSDDRCAHCEIVIFSGISKESIIESNLDKAVKAGANQVFLKSNDYLRDFKKIFKIISRLP